MTLDDDDRREIDRALSVHIASQLGIMDALGLLTNAMVEQGVLDKAKLLESIKMSRRKIADAEQRSSAFARPLDVVATTALNAGPDKLPQGWLTQLIIGPAKEQTVVPPKAAGGKSG